MSCAATIFKMHTGATALVCFNEIEIMLLNQVVHCDESMAVKLLQPWTEAI